jgi:hypothetical protein
MNRIPSESWMYGCGWKKSRPKVCIAGSEAEKPPLGTALPLAMSRSAWESKRHHRHSVRANKKERHSAPPHGRERAGLPLLLLQAIRPALTLTAQHSTARQKNTIRSIWVFSNNFQSLDDLRTNSQRNDHAGRRSLTDQGLHRH